MKMHFSVPKNITVSVMRNPYGEYFTQNHHCDVYFITSNCINVNAYWI